MTTTFASWWLYYVFVFSKYIYLSILYIYVHVTKIRLISFYFDLREEQIYLIATKNSFMTIKIALYPRSKFVFGSCSFLILIKLSWIIIIFPLTHLYFIKSIIVKNMTSQCWQLSGLFLNLGAKAQMVSLKDKIWKLN